MNSNERSIVGITMLGHAIVHVFELSIPVFIPLWIEEFSITPATIGIVVAVGYGLFGLGALPSGILTDRFGSTRLILLGIVGMTFSFGLLSLAPSLMVVTIALLMWGAAASVYHPAGLSLISTGVRNRGTALGYHGVAGNVGIALGPLATMLLLLVVPWRGVAAVLAIPGALAALVVVVSDVDETVSEPTATDGGRDRTASDGDPLAEFGTNARRLFAGGFALVFVLYILEGLYYRGTLTFLPELLGGFSLFTPVTVGDKTVDPTQYIYAGLLLVGVVGQYASGKLSDRIAPEKGIVGVFAGLIVIALAFIPAVNAGPISLLVVSAFLGVFLFGVQPLMQASVANHSPPDVRGVSYGFVFAGLFGIGTAGAAITGIVLTYAGPRELFLVAAGYAAVAVLVGRRLLR